MSYGVPEYDIVMLQNYMLMIFNKIFCNKKGHYLCQTLCVYVPDPVCVKCSIIQPQIREEILTDATIWMKLNDTLSEISQTQEF